MNVQPNEPVATLIGDLAGSREVADRSRLQAGLEQVLGDVNRLTEPAQPLEPTLGDEFQGVYSDVPSAARASLLLRLGLLDRAGIDSRYGLGYGAVAVFDAARAPKSQDGPGWWAARAAIGRAAELAKRPRTTYTRTCFEREGEAMPMPPGEALALDALLMSRDAIVDRMSPRGRRLLLGLLRGWTQAEIADHEGITQSAVSQGLARSGAFAVEAAQRRLEGATP
jgi:hypothetical protein